MARRFLCLCLVAKMGVALSQSPDSQALHFYPLWQDSLLQLSPSLQAGEAISVSGFQAYITHIELWDRDSCLYKDPQAYLIDASNPASLQLALHPPAGAHATHLKFGLGVDSLTSVSGAFSGDLDPVNGMYWTWQSGYINLKLEGHSTFSPARRKDFAFHLGGYQAPSNTFREVELAVIPGNPIHIGIQVDRLFEGLDWQRMNHIMSPGPQAMELADMCSTLFIPLK